MERSSHDPCLRTLPHNPLNPLVDRRAVYDPGTILGVDSPVIGVLLVIVVTVWFNLLGAIPAFIFSRRARSRGLRTRRYWIAFVATLAGELLVGGLLLAVVLVDTTTDSGDHSPSTSPNPQAIRADAIAKQLAERVRHEDATGTPVGVFHSECYFRQAGAQGGEEYRCLVDFFDGATIAHAVTLAANLTDWTVTLTWPARSWKLPPDYLPHPSGSPSASPVVPSPPSVPLSGSIPR